MKTDRWLGWCRICKKNRLMTNFPGSTALVTCSQGHQIIPERKHKLRKKHG